MERIIKLARRTAICAAEKLVKGKIKPSSSQQIWAKDGGDAPGPGDKPYRRRNRYANKPPTREPFVAINDEDQQLYMDGEGNLSPSNQQKLKKLKNGQVVRVAVPMPASANRKKKMSGWRFFISLVAIVAVLGGVVFGFYKGVQFVSGLIGRAAGRGGASGAAAGTPGGASHGGWRVMAQDYLLWRR